MNRGAYAPGKSGARILLTEGRRESESVLAPAPRGETRANAALLPGDADGPRMAAMTLDPTPAEEPAPPIKVIDPVCGMKVDPAKARGGSHEHGGVTYSFCGPRCNARFQADPESFLQRAARPRPRLRPSRRRLRRELRPRQQQQLLATSARWIPRSSPITRARVRSAVWRSSWRCRPPMKARARARRHAPALLRQPRADDPGLRAGDDRHAAGDAGHARARRGAALDRARARAAGRALGRRSFFARAATSLRTGRLNMFTLIAVGTGAALLYSLVAVIVPGRSRGAPRSSRGAAGVLQNRPR